MSDKETQFATIDDSELGRVVGGLGDVNVGGGGTNQDSSTQVGPGGVIMDRQFKQRTDDGYRQDAIRQACEQKNTGFWGVDRKAAADCVLQQMKK
jgi:hypothetical protein